MGPPTLKRLVHDGQRWTLEIERLVPIDTNVLRPKLDVWHHPDAILARLEEHPDGAALLEATRALLREAGGPRAFEPRQGRWTPCAFSTPRTHDEHPSPPASTASEIPALRLAIERLSARIDALERCVRALEPPADASIEQGDHETKRGN